MCGLVGIILGNKKRTEDDFEWIKRSMTSLLIKSQARGPHATGIAVIRRDGSYQLLKRPLPAAAFVETEEYEDVMAELDDEVTIILGHTRFRTIGTEKRPNNNHPIRAGRIIGTHNGTIYNAEHIARMYGLNRFADVDSEVLFRVADKFRNPTHFKSRLKNFRGQLTAVMINLNRPERIRIYKGNKPLCLRMVDDLDACLYISDKSHFETIDFEGIHYKEHRYKQNRVITVDTSAKLKQNLTQFTFQAERRKSCLGSLYTGH